MKIYHKKAVYTGLAAIILFTAFVWLQYDPRGLTGLSTSSLPPLASCTSESDCEVGWPMCAIGVCIPCNEANKALYPDRCEGVPGFCDGIAFCYMDDNGQIIENTGVQGEPPEGATQCCHGRGACCERQEVSSSGIKTLTGRCTEVWDTDTETARDHCVRLRHDWLGYDTECLCGGTSSLPCNAPSQCAATAVCCELDSASSATGRCTEIAGDSAAFQCINNGDYLLTGATSCTPNPCNILSSSSSSSSSSSNSSSSNSSSSSSGFSSSSSSSSSAGKGACCELDGSGKPTGTCAITSDEASGWKAWEVCAHYNGAFAGYGTDCGNSSLGIPNPCENKVCCDYYNQLCYDRSGSCILWEVEVTALGCFPNPCIAASSAGNSASAGNSSSVGAPEKCGESWEGICKAACDTDCENEEMFTSNGCESGKKCCTPKTCLDIPGSDTDTFSITFTGLCDERNMIVNKLDDYKDKYNDAAVGNNPALNLSPAYVDNLKITPCWSVSPPSVPGSCGEGCQDKGLFDKITELRFIHGPPNGTIDDPWLSGKKVPICDYSYSGNCIVRKNCELPEQCNNS